MNYLGHLYFSEKDKELMYANLFGDHVKGRDLSAFPSLIQKGIKLHRSIDYFIDNHIEVKKLKLEMYEVMPKVSGIAVDLLFDHLLAKNWNLFSNQDYHSFLEEFYSYHPILNEYYTAVFISFIENLKKYRWIDVYEQEFGLVKMSEGGSKKISFENKLALLPEFYKNNSEWVDQVFLVFMKDAQAYFQNAVIR